MALEDSKPVKKEEESNSKSSLSKKVSSSNSKVTKVKKEELKSVKKEPNVKKELKSVKKESNVKKELNDNYDDDDDKPLAKRTSNAMGAKEVKKKKIKIKGEGKKAEEKKKKEKKVYELPGQKRDPPEEKDPLRIFYQSLYNQVPTSQMSQIWLMESGLLPKDVAKKVYEKKKVSPKLSSPNKVAVKSNTKSVTVKKKSPASPVSSVKKKTTTNSTSNQSKKRKSKDLSSEDDDDTDSDEIILKVAKRRKVA